MFTSTRTITSSRSSQRTAPEPNETEEPEDSTNPTHQDADSQPLSAHTAPGTPQSSPRQAIDPFQERFGGLPLPRDLREEARGMDWSLFRAMYSPEPMLAISNLESTDGRFGAEVTRHSKTRPSRICFRETDATGPVSACTRILAAEGCPIEILSFHQIPIFQATATIIRAHHGSRTEWAVGFGATNETSIAHAMSCAATRLHG